MLTEIYYINNKDLTKNESRVNFVELNSILPYESYSINSQTKMYSQDGSYAGIYYINKNVQLNTFDNTINSTITNTVSIDNKGILFFLTSYNDRTLEPNNITISEPTFQSDFYLNKKINIVVELLPNIEQTVKIMIIFYD